METTPIHTWRTHPHPKLHSWVGGPGTGKTEHLISAFRNEVASGVNFPDIRYTTFTNAQRDDVIARLNRVYSRKKTVLRRTVKTLHGAALESLNQTEYAIRGNQGIIDEVKNPGPYMVFCKKEGLPYSPAKPLRDDDNDESLSPGEPPLGNVLFAISQYIRQHYGWSPGDWGRASNATGLFQIRRHPDPEAVIQRWWGWKKQNKLFEHDDYVNLAIDVGAPAPAPVIIIDEFQDLSPVQNALFRMWLDDPIVERIYIAGDPNQAIYDFRGADPRFLEEAHTIAHGGQIPDDRPKSHRCLGNIVVMADQVLGKQSHMEPAGEGGIARWLQARNDTEFTRAVETLRGRYGKVMIICRFTHYMQSISKTLQEVGIPHTSLTNRLPAWTDVRIPGSRAPKDKNGKPLKAGVSMTNVLQALRIVDRYIAGKDLGFIPVDAAKDLLYLLPIPDEKVTSALAAIDRKMVNYTVDDLMSLFPHHPGSLEIAEHLEIPPRRRDTLVRALIRGGDTLPEHIVVDTIHAAKGLESPAVLIHTGFSQKRWLECIQDEQKAAAERRVYYVALTRASEAAYLFSYGATTPHPVVDDIRGINFGDWDGTRYPHDRN